MVLRSLVCFLKVLSTKKNLNKKNYFFAVVFHTTISRSYFTGFFIEITFLITIKANKAPSISAII